MSLSLELAENPNLRLTPFLSTARRYGLSAFGPVATSGAHFLASLLFVRSLPAAGFGLFSFVLVIVPFAMSMMASLLVIPVTRALTQPSEARALVVASCLKMNLLLSLVTALCVFGLLLAAQSRIPEPALLPALLLGLFGGALTFRWFARCYAFVEGRLVAAIASDIVYAVSLVLGLGILAWSHRVTLTLGAAALLLTALASLAPLGRKFFADQFAALFTGRLRLYGVLFRDVTRWSLLGVVFSEVTANAHAYLVTFLSGPGSFALLALGMLLMRPAALVQSALPDLERPRMTRQIAAGDWPGLTRTAREFGGGLFAMLLVTLALDAVLLIWFPGLVLKKTYALHSVIVVAAISAAITALRCLRGPPSVLLQAAGAFKELAGIGLKSSAVTVAATLALLLAFGPIASLGGILAGELTVLICLYRLVAAWELSVAERIIVAIPTFRRPKNLARLLEALSRLDGDADIAVLVADNDAEKQEGLTLCRQIAGSYRWPLQAVLAPERGIAQVRNTLVAEALADPDARFVAMIDDDEWPAPDWITQFQRARRQTGADALQGAILFAADRGGCETRPDIRGRDGVTMLESAGNLFIARAMLRAMTRPWFDPAFALTGGEDRDFFLRLEAEGARFAWADGARVYGDVPEARATLGWTLRRAYSNGNSDMQVLLKHRPGPGTRLTESAKIAATLLLSLPLAVILCASPNRRAAPLSKLFRAAGKLTAMAGWRYNEYAVVHGE